MGFDKILGMGGGGSRIKWLNFGGDPDYELGPGLLMQLTAKNRTWQSSMEVWAHWVLSSDKCQWDVTVSRMLSADLLVGRNARKYPWTYPLSRLRLDTPVPRDVTQWINKIKVKATLFTDWILTSLRYKLIRPISHIIPNDWRCLTLIFFFFKFSTNQDWLLPSPRGYLVNVFAAIGLAVTSLGASTKLLYVEPG